MPRRRSPGSELLERPARDDSCARARPGNPTRRACRSMVAGQRRVFDILDLPARDGSAGIGIDATEVERCAAELAHMVEAHRRTLDQLPTAVAIFSAGQRLTFSNAAYRTLWDLDPAFLDQHPTDSAVLDRLRAARKLPEQLDFRQWRNQLHEAYRALEPKEHWWHLPDGRTLRVVPTPNPEGGITYVFDDVTERLDLERRYDALIRVQGETLENLAEGVAVFASDGRLRLHNPAFARMWKCRGRPLRPAAYRERHRLVPPAADDAGCGRRCAAPSPGSTAAKRWPDDSNAATAAWSIARPCRCRMARRWSASRT